MSLLSLTAVSRTFGRVVALQDVDLEMEEGRLYAVIGPNGAGKTTLFNLISGFYPASSGQIRFDGQQINRVPAANRVTLGLVRTFQITEIFPELSVFENVRIGVEAEARCSARPWWSPGLSRQINERVDELLSITGLTAQSGRTVSELAHGDQRVVEVAMALSLNPRLLLLDEPTAGMGDTESDHMVGLIGRLHKEQGVSILFIEHDMDIVFGIAQRVTVLDQGRVLADGTPDAIAADPKVRVAYLGTDAS
jgi:branched-chain amino acid transport system ATP-binding protein